MDQRADVVVIGTGPGGYHAAIRAAQLGKSVVAVDRGPVGGVCLNVGCIPTKALLHVGELAHRARDATSIGLSIPTVALDIEGVRAFTGRAVQANVGGVEALFRTNRVSLLRGHARFTGPDRIAVSANGIETAIRAGAIVIATGAEPAVPPALPRDGTIVIDSNDAVALADVPQTMLVVGGGVVGLELATVYQRLGSRVTIVELGPDVLAGVDGEIVRLLVRTLAGEGIEIRTSTTASLVDVDIRARSARVELRSTSSGEREMRSFDRVLVATGRRPVTRGLDIEAAGLTVDARGFLEVDARRQTSVAGIYAVGDVAGEPLLAHKAMREGVVAAEAISGEKGAAYDPVAVPACIYTDPQVASVGLTEDEARARGYAVRVGRFPLSASGRARTMNESDGLFKLVGDAKTDLLLGMQILAPHAESLIGEGVIALEMNATLEDIALSMHPHPTLTEAIHDAAEHAHDRAIHIANRRPPRAARPSGSSSVRSSEALE
jgi:dihydrolipoamide dehydrogenase